MSENLQRAVLRTKCGCHRFVLIDGELTEYSMPKMPYKQKAIMDYYTKDVPEGTPRRLFKYNGQSEYGPYAEIVRVFEESDEVSL